MMKPALVLVFLSAVIVACSSGDPQPAAPGSEAANAVAGTPAIAEQAPVQQDQWLVQAKNSDTPEPVTLPETTAEMVPALPEPGPAASPPAATLTPDAAAKSLAVPSAPEAIASPPPAPPLPASPGIVDISLTDENIEKFITVTNQLAQLPKDNVTPADVESVLSRSDLTLSAYSSMIPRITAAVALAGQDQAAPASDQAKADRNAVSKRLDEVNKALNAGGLY